MSGSPPRYSPDGAWYWDGARWVPAPSRGPAWARPYAPPEARAAAAVALIGLATASSGLFLVGEGLDLLDALLGSGTVIGLTGAILQLFGSAASVAGFVGTAIAVPMWMHRAYRNLPALGAVGLRWSPAWAAGAWFIPLANLVVPFLVARDLSIHAGGTEEAAWPLLPAWWAAWVGANVLQAASAAAGRSSRIAGDGLGMLNDAALLVAGVLLILFVQQVTRRQARVAPG